jgi:hypothetical protein
LLEVEAPETEAKAEALKIQALPHHWTRDPSLSSKATNIKESSMKKTG